MKNKLTKIVIAIFSISSLITGSAFAGKTQRAANEAEEKIEQAGADAAHSTKKAGKKVKKTTKNAADKSNDKIQDL